jgi:ribosome biogenesis GTPase
VKAVKAIEHVDPVAVGDIVQVIESEDGSGVIVEIMPRRNKLARRTAVPMPTAHPFEQVIAANVDRVVPVFAAARPAPKWNMLDRYLASAKSLGLPALICITKLDLAQAGEGLVDADLQSTADEYRKIVYPVVFTSAVTGVGLVELKQALQGRISVLVGKSGVGKTSLLNALQPGLGLRVNEVNQMSPFIGKCRFGLDCQHDEEPGCAIRKAVIAGRVSPRRYQSYMRLKAEGYF